MYKIGSFEEEIFQSMEKNLVTNQMETKHGFNKLAKAAELLSSAATTFEKAGMQEEAEEVTHILKLFAAEISEKTLGH